MAKKFELIQVEKQETTQEPTQEKTISLDEAWDTLKRPLQDFVVHAVETMAYELRLAPWQLVLGLVQKAWADSTLSSPLIDPTWRESVDWTRKKGNCKFCGQEFELQGPLQKFCSNKCGKEYEKRRIASLSTQE